MIHADVLFSSDPTQGALARELFEHTRDLPLICPHGHVDPVILAEDGPFADPASLLVTPDHYLTRMLWSHGVPPGRMGVSSIDGAPVETDGRAIWRTFAEHWYLFRGTPSWLWLEKALADVFSIETPLSPGAADDIYDAIQDCLQRPEFRPRALFEKFGIETLATTESPLDALTHHARLAADGWGRRVITTFRPDDVVDMDGPGWVDRVRELGELAGEDTSTYPGYLAALRGRREEFIKSGATSSDHGHPTARTARLDPIDAREIYARALCGRAERGDADAFRAHMLLEFARMSADDGLVMQIHPGSVRNHNQQLYESYGRDVGGDIPQPTDYVHALKPLLDEFGNNSRMTIVLYTLDETAFSRELAPIAGGYPAVYLGAPWWFLDAPEALQRFRSAVTETAGFYNTAGFVDDTRAFCSIPVRHEIARRADAVFLARLVAEHRLPLDEATETAIDLAYRLPKRVFRLDAS